LSSRDGVVLGHLLVEVENQTHLNKVLRAVRRVKGVTEIARRDVGATPTVPPA
jgi:DNA-binding phage protein